MTLYRKKLQQQNQINTQNQSENKEVNYKNNDIFVYTVNIGNYDQPRTDATPVIDERTPERFTLQQFESRFPKICFQHFIPEKTEIVIYTDSNIYLKKTPEQIAEIYLGNSDLAIFKHPYRNCLYKEIECVIQTERLQNPYLQRKIRIQKENYKKLGMPENFGLWENNFIIRRNTSKVIDFMNMWFIELLKFQWRDQVSFPFVLWNFLKQNPNFKFKTIIDDNIRNNQNFSYINHY